MKGYRPKLTPDRAATERLYLRLRDLTHDRCDVMKVAGGPFYMSRSSYEQLQRQTSRNLIGQPQGILPLIGIEIRVVDWLPTFTKRHRPSVQRRIARQKQNGGGR